VSARPSRRRGDDGSALLMVLTFMVVIGLIGAAILGLQSTTYRAQTAVINKNSIDVDTQNALTSGVEMLRRDTTGTLGRDQTGGGNVGCNDRAPAPPFTLVDYKNPTTHDEYVVKCAPIVGSGLGGGAGGADIPKSVIVTLGGATGDGNDKTDTSASDDAIPFCDNFAPGDNDTTVSGPVCEAGIYIGKATSDFGLTVASNGANGTQELVRSNSSIIVRSDGATTRALNVKGGVWARRFCTTNRVLANVGQLSADHDPHCPGADDTSLAPMTIDCTGAQQDGRDCFPWLPRVDALNSMRFPGDALGRMQPVTLPATCGASNPGFFVFHPGYYNDVTALNNLLSNSTCKDALFQFTPGVYYFDFRWISNTIPTAWTMPTTPNGSSPSEFIGGDPPSTGAGQVVAV